jgi:hypothetical protein
METNGAKGGAAAERLMAPRPTGNGGGEVDDQPRRFSSRRKVETVLRLLRGESLDVLSRKLGVTAARLSAWRDMFLAHGRSALLTRQPDAKDDEIRRLRAKIGEITMENELFREEARRLKAGLPLPPGRSRR